MTLLVFIATSILVPIVISEATDWCPWLAARLIRRATRVLPGEFRDRYQEEWLAELQVLPGGKITKLGFGLRIYLGAPNTVAALLGVPASGSFRLKAVVDRVVGVGALVLLSPAFAVIATLIWLTDRGPVLTTEVRVGLGGQEFVLLKFRTATRGSVRGIPMTQVERRMTDPTVRVCTALTSIGAWLNKRSLDQLPALLNVARGQMSLVGPRASRPRDVVQNGDDARRRLAVKPGLTGPWDVLPVSPDEALQLEIEYVDHYSPVKDIKAAGRIVSSRFRCTWCGGFRCVWRKRHRRPKAIHYDPGPDASE